MTLKRTIIATAVVLVVLAGCGSSSKKSSSTTKPASAPATAANSGGTTGNAVQIKGFAFGPQSLNAKVGTKVTWTNKDSVNHTVTSDKSDPASFDSGHLAGGKTFSFTFAKAGTYTYMCNIHTYMKGTVVVS